MGLLDQMDQLQVHRQIGCLNKAERFYNLKISLIWHFTQLYSNLKVFIGPGAKKEAEIVGFGLGSLSANQLEDLELAQKYAMDQSIKYVMEKQRQAHQQQVFYSLTG